MASINSASATASTHYMGWSQAACNVALPTVSNTASDGNAYLQIENIRMGLAGRGAARTVAIAIWNTSNTLLKATGNFSVAADTGASLTTYKALTSPLLINRSSVSTVQMGFWVSGNGSTYYLSDDTGQSTDIYYDSTSSSGAANFGHDAILNSNTSLVGNYDTFYVPTAPASITVTAGNAQVTVGWSAPSDNGGKSISGYMLERATNAGFTTGLTTISNAISSSATSYTDTTAVNGTTYYYRIGAKNAVTASVSTTTTSVKTASGSVTPAASGTVPGNPTALTVTQQSPQNNTGLALSWTAPSGTITSYTIRYGIDGVTFPSTAVTGSNATTFNLNNLTTSSTYYVQVAATNAVGTGPYSDTASGKTYTSGSAGVGVIKRWDSSLGAWIIVV